MVPEGKVSPASDLDVLVVDDDADLCDALATALDLRGFTVVAVGSGAEALDRLQAGARPCVMLIDIRMPEMTGWWLWERMRSDPSLAGIPVVLMSGEEQDRAHALARGIRDVLLKPIEVAHVVELIQRYCGRVATPAT